MRKNLIDQSTTTSTVYKDMQRRLTILDKEKDLIQVGDYIEFNIVYFNNNRLLNSCSSFKNSLKERLFNFNELVLKLRSEMQSLKINDDENSTGIKEILSTCNQKVFFF